MRYKLGEWSKRYIPAEVAGTLSALIGAGLAFNLTGNLIITAFIGTLTENIGYYGHLFCKDIQKRLKTDRHKGMYHIICASSKEIKSLLFEFGPAEFIDSFVSRPFLLYIFPTITGNLMIGLLLGKLFADILFYIPTVFMYEMKKRLILMK